MIVAIPTVFGAFKTQLLRSAEVSAYPVIMLFSSISMPELAAEPAEPFLFKVISGSVTCIWVVFSKIVLPWMLTIAPELPMLIVVAFPVPIAIEVAVAVSNAGERTVGVVMEVEKVLAPAMV